MQVVQVRFLARHPPWVCTAGAGLSGTHAHTHIHIYSCVCVLRQVKGPASFNHSREDAILHHVPARILCVCKGQYEERPQRETETIAHTRELQIIDTGHDRGQEAIRVHALIRLLAHNGQRRVEAPQPWAVQRGIREISAHAS